MLVRLTVYKYTISVEFQLIPKALISHTPFQISIGIAIDVNLTFLY